MLTISRVNHNQYGQIITNKINCVVHTFFVTIYDKLPYNNDNIGTITIQYVSNKSVAILISYNTYLKECAKTCPKTISKPNKIQIQYLRKKSKNLFFIIILLNILTPFPLRIVRLIIPPLPHYVKRILQSEQHYKCLILQFLSGPKYSTKCEKAAHSSAA